MLKHRLSVGIPLLVLALISFLCSGWLGAVVFVLLVGVFLLTALNEFFVLMSQMGHAGFRRTTLLAGVALLAGTLVASGTGYGTLMSRSLLVDAAIIVGFLGVVWVQVLRESPSPQSIGKLLVSLSGLIYIAWPSLLVVKLYFGGADMTGRGLAFYIIAVTKLADVGAFVVGTSTARRPQGNHKMFPQISPKKSWEGLAGGLALSVAASIFMVTFFGDQMAINGKQVLSLWSALLFGCIGALVGLLGDLAESALKRAAQAKDSGALPGLGGALDIIDSLIFVMPTFYIYVCFRAMAL